MVFISGLTCLDLSQIWLDFSETWLAFSQYGWISPDGLPFIFLYLANGSGTSRKIPAFGLWSFLELHPWELLQPHTGISLYSLSLYSYVLQGSALSSTMPYGSALYLSILQGSALSFTMLYYKYCIMYSTVQHCTALHGRSLYSTAQHYLHCTWGSLLCPGH